MKRKATGEYIVRTGGGERVAAFVPSPLPPSPPLEVTPEMRDLADQAILELGRLDGISSVLPDTGLFLYTYVRKEAVLSSQIEGTQSSLSDLLLFEIEAAPGVPIEDAREAANYVAAMEHGLKRLREGFPLSNRLIREVHGRLLAKGRGSDKSPGEFRRSQNWIGGARPAVAAFVPPPPDRVASCMAALEKYLNDMPVRTPALFKAALAHAQFETIHPFLDGNGRLGRLLITLILCHDRVLQEPMLYLSLYFKQHRRDYYALLSQIRTEGDWERWVAFFLRAVSETAAEAVKTANRLSALVRKDRDATRGIGRVAGSALRVLDLLVRRPVLSIPVVCRETGLAPNTVAKVMAKLTEAGLVKEVTGKRRNRVFIYHRYLRVLNEGTEPLK
ncbi:MAG: Fic family protein [bacterium]